MDYKVHRKLNIIANFMKIPCYNIYPKKDIIDLLEDLDKYI